MDLLNPANPLNMINPASPWYHVWNSHDTTYKAAEVATDVTLTTADKFLLGVVGVGVVCAVIAFVYMLWDIARS